MIIGVPKERKIDEYRVGITPEGAGMLVGDGHRVLVEQSAGDGSGMSDQQYLTAGAVIVPSEEELFDQADMVVKVKEHLARVKLRFREPLAKVKNRRHVYPSTRTHEFMMDVKRVPQTEKGFNDARSLMWPGSSKNRYPVL